jgi:hypothetical protein
LAHLPDFLGSEAGDICTVAIRLGCRSGHHRDHSHGIVELTSVGTCGERQLKVWLKFCREGGRVFDTYRKAYDASGWVEKFLPRPYFCHSCGPLNASIWVAEHVSGNRLREVILRSSVSRDAVQLELCFFRLGARLRSFHDTRATAAICTIDDSAPTSLIF